MNTLLAKSTGETLIEHSQKVSEVAEYIAHSVINTSEEEKKTLISIIKKAALLHDIGKAESGFQTLLNDTIQGKSTKKKKIEFAHNEVGWAFVRLFMSFEPEELQQVADAVYWHHGIHNEMSKHTDAAILAYIDKKKDDSIDRMIEFAKELFPNQTLDKPKEGETSTPHYYIRDYTETHDANVDNTIIRMCLVRADHLVSEYEDSSVEELKSVVDEQSLQGKEFRFEANPYPSNKERWKQQVALVSRTTNTQGGNVKTAQINAPAGFGKTLLALLWSTNTNRKLIWVCPRNAVAHSVYYSIIRELKNAGLDTSVELYYAGKQQESNSNVGINFISDIIVTNVDNFLKPTKEHCNDIDLMLVSEADVVFDEYHELVSDGALLAGFVNMMKVRHRMTNGRSLLLSATPLDLSHHWDSIFEATTHLPGRFKHAPAVHSKKYRLSTKDGSVNIPTNKPGPFLMVSNSIAECQRNKNANFEDTRLFHGKFEDDDKQERLKEILEDYGKKSERNINKDHVIASPIAQASLDVSFRHLIESCMSPEATLQRVGRCDRWGDYDGQSGILVYRLPSDSAGRSENTTRRTLYTSALSDAWFKTISANKGELTLDEFYTLYNKHCKENEAERKAWLKTKYRESRKDLHEKIYPVRFVMKDDSGSEQKTIQKTSYRSTGQEIFFTAKHYLTKEWTKPKSIRIYKSIPEDFHETARTQIFAIKAIKALHDSNEEEFDYSRFLRMKKGRQTLDMLRIFAQHQSMPYPRFDEKYHDVYGYIRVSLLEEFQQPIYITV